MRPQRVALALALAALPPIASAQPVAPRERFVRGVALAAEGDWRTALIEFRAAYDGTGNPEVLFNLAAAHEHLNEYVEALDALDRYQRLAPPRAVELHRAEVVSAMSRLVNRIGALRVVTSPPAPRCTVDGAAQPIERLREGLRVSAGRRVVRCEAAGHQPREVAVDVAPNAVAEALVDLVRVRATIAVTVDRAGAEVRLDGRPVGQTPLAAPLTVDEGAHSVAVSLPGYEPVTRDVEARADLARVDVALAWSDPVPAEVAGRLVVRASEPGAIATLDGRSVPSDGSRPLPPGAHRLRVERENFRAVERDVSLAPGASTVEDVALAPTPAFRMMYLADARAQRWRWVVVGGAGLALTLLGGVLTGLYGAPALDADGRAVDADAAFVACSADTACASPQRLGALAADRDAAAAERDELRPLAITGVAVLGVGLVGTVVGAVLLAGADPLDRFERRPVFRVGLGPSSAAVALAF